MKPFLLALVISFALVQALALGLGAIFVSQEVSIVEDSSDVGNSFFLLGYVVFAAIVLLLVLKFYRGKKLFFILELLLEFTAVQIAFSAILPQYGEAAAFAAGVLAVAVRVFLAQAKTTLLLLSTAVVGAVLGSSLDLFPAALFAVLLAAYDYIAVFHTKHMVELAQKLEEREASFSVSFGEEREAPPAPNEPQTQGKPKKQGGKKELGGIELGTGDLVIPAMLSVSALKFGAFPNIAAGFAAALGSVFGLLLLFYILEKRRGYLPALPPIVFASLLFLGLELLASSLWNAF